MEAHVKGWYTDQYHYSSTYHKATQAVAYTIHYDGSIYLDYKGIHDSTVVYQGTVSLPDPNSYVDMAKGVTCTWAWSKARSGFYDWFWNYHWLAEVESSIAVS